MQFVNVVLSKSDIIYGHFNVTKLNYDELNRVQKKRAIPHYINAWDDIGTKKSGQSWDLILGQR